MMLGMDDSRFATHPEPAWRERTNYIIQVDLAPYEMGGAFEQLWARTKGDELFELCCIPFFTYGFALGDIVAWDDATSTMTPVAKGGHRNLRVAFTDKEAASSGHAALHSGLVGTGCLFEFASSGYVAVDIVADDQVERVLAVVAPWVDAGVVGWEWGADQS